MYLYHVACSDVEQQAIVCTILTEAQLGVKCFKELDGPNVVFTTEFPLRLETMPALMQSLASKKSLRPMGIWHQ